MNVHIWKIGDFFLLTYNPQEFNPGDIANHTKEKFETIDELLLRVKKIYEEKPRHFK